MDDATETLDAIINQLENPKSKIFYNTINGQTVKQYASLLKVILIKLLTTLYIFIQDMITTISENELFKKMVKSEDLKEYYEDKYIAVSQAVLFFSLKIEPFFN